MRTLPTFFGVLELLLRAGATTVAEAAFQDRVWRPGLEPLRGLAQLRIVHCVTDADIALTRKLRRWQENPLRRAHADLQSQDAPTPSLSTNAFDRVSVQAPWIEVDTTDGYAPNLNEVVAFVNGSG
jgi:hypothetical protein